MNEGGSLMNDIDQVGGYAVPMDPMDLLQCDSCQ
ncbi:ribonucleotide-diphosphate reductase subunit beta [Amnibacterium sp. CER49]|nr:ribonucleotide-diphosphate reductase subunit beta [Amnibacterium sp. CER49]MDH2444199.1 ribonucleotide-diphosphate reductase subunit beta [Amnibacterium sp. CER49]